MKFLRITAVLLALSLLTACTPGVPDSQRGATSASADDPLPTSTNATVADESAPEEQEATEPLENAPEADGDTAEDAGGAHTGDAAPTVSEKVTTGSATTGSAATTAKPTTSVSSKPTVSGTVSAGTSTTTGSAGKPQNTASTITTKPSTSATSGTTGSGSYPAATENSVLMFNRGTQTIFVGESAKVDYIYFGSKTLTWFTSHPQSVTVDNNGKVTPIREGNYVLYVTDGQYTAQADIFAPYGWGMDSGMRFDSTKAEMIVGQSFLLSLSHVSPGSLLSYSSSNTSVVRTSGSYITAVAPGTAVITAKTAYDFARITVTVVSAPNTVSLDIQKSNLSMYMFDQISLDYTYTGTGTLTWESSNWNIARIDENGLIFAAGEGTCSIYLSDGKYADECEVTVSIEPSVKVTALDFRSTNGPIYNGVTKYKGDYIEFEIGVTPQNADRDTYVTVSDSSIIKVDRNYNGGSPRFRLDFKKAGTCTVSIHSGDNEVTNSYTIHVKDNYSCHPGKELLTPEEFVSCYNQILEANGMKTDYKPTGYLVLTLSPDALTWTQARKSAEGLGHHWWSIGYRTMQVTFEGINEDGNYVFYERGCS